MITYRPLDGAHLLPTCLHGGPLPVGAAAPAYVETVSDLPAWSVADGLRRLSTRYGACGLLALEGDLVVGKLRFYPQAVLDRVPYPCLQQEHTVRPLLALSDAELPDHAESPVLHLYCLQVAAGYTGQGIGGRLLDGAVAWAREHGWLELRARAVQPIPPLLDWCGQLSRAALERRGFTVQASRVDPALREGVVSQRAGHHGAEVAARWVEYAAMSDDEAGTVFTMACAL